MKDSSVAKKACFLLLSGLIIASASMAGTLELYVSQDGKPSNPGTLEKPFSSLLQARDAIRQLRKTGEADKPITVFVRGGEYLLDETLVLTKEDSGTKTCPVVYQAYKEETPVLVGGVAISGWTPCDGKILKADLSSTLLKGKAFRVLIFDGKRQQIARYPNHNPKDIHRGDWAYVDGKRFIMYADSPDENDYHKTHQHLDYWQRNIPRLTRTLKVKEQDVHKWSNLQQGEVSIFPRFNWWHYVLKVKSFDPNERMLHLDPGNFYEIRPGDRYFIRGLLEELDSPGEWYYDQQESILYFWPPESVENKPLYASVLKNIIKIENCSNVTVQGFTIECCEGTAIDINESSNCVIAANRIRNSGDGANVTSAESFFEGSAISVQDGSEIGIIGNDIYDIGSYGIYLSGGDVNSLTLSGHYAENNYIHHIGVVDRKAKAIELQGAGHIVRHNLIHDIPQSGIYVWGSKHLIEYNHIRHTCLEGEDTGAIGGGAIDWLSWQGVIIRYNIIADTIGFGYDFHNTKKWRSSYLTWALYPDWAASGVQIVGNIIVRAPLGLIHCHSGRENLIENNILIDGEVNQMLWQGWTTETGFWSTMVDGWIKKYETAIKYPAWQAVPTLKDPRKVPLADGSVMLDNVFRRNIICYRNPSAQLFMFPKVPFERNESDYNLIYHFGEPLRTGQSSLKAEVGPNLIDTELFEAADPGKLPSKWGQVALPEGFKASIETEQSHSGTRSLRIISPDKEENETAPKILYMTLGTIPFKPSNMYRLTAWLKAESEDVSVELDAFSWIKDSHHWAKETVIKLTPQWKQYELLFRLPGKDDTAFRSTMKDLGVRVNVPAGRGTIWVDDVSLRIAEMADEWESWKMKGMDQHSIVADPCFLDPGNDDYRLKPESPAYGLGFKQIPVEKIGPYKDTLRASWPILEAVGYREAKKYFE